MSDTQFRAQLKNDMEARELAELEMRELGKLVGELRDSKKATLEYTAQNGKEAADYMALKEQMRSSGLQ